MNTCSLELFIDQGAKKDPSDGSRLMMHSTGELGRPGSVNVFNLQVGDQIQISIYDVGAAPLPTPQAKGEIAGSLTVGFAAAEDADHGATPVSQRAFTAPCTYIDDRSSSKTFGKALNGKTTYPRYVLAKANGDAHFYPVHHEGRFLYTLTFTYTFGGSQEVFRVDPEMIVGAGRGG